jgi:hypothetical protein
VTTSYRPATQDRKEVRRKMYAKIHVIWAQLRPDLKKGSDDYKEALYMFAEAELKLPQIGSFTELTQPQLARVIEALEREQSQPALYQQRADNVVQFKPNPHHASAVDQQAQADVQHLASQPQRYAINRLFSYLGWGDYGREKFLENKFRCKSVEMLLQKQAHSCIRILLNAAGSKYWKAQGKETVSKPMIAAAIPKIKQEIGIR